MKNRFLVVLLVCLVFSLYSVSAVTPKAVYNGTLQVSVGPTVQFTFGNPPSFNVTNIPATCTTGQTTCVGTNYYLCVNNNWVNQGNVNGQCGYIITATVASSGNPSGGGVGGGIPVTTPTTGGSCSENWQCGGWSACVSGIQTRTCKDTNNCGTSLNMPPLSQTCISNYSTEIRTISPNFLTGAVTGIGNFVKSKEGIATLSGLITIVVLTIAITSIRRNRRIRQQ